MKFMMPCRERALFGVISGKEYSFEEILPGLKACPTEGFQKSQESKSISAELSRYTGKAATKATLPEKSTRAYKNSPGT